MWGLGAIRDGAAGLVKQGAGAVKQGVEAGAKLLENLDEVKIRKLHEKHIIRNYQLFGYCCTLQLARNKHTQHPSGTGKDGTYYIIRVLDVIMCGLIADRQPCSGGIGRQ